MLQVTDIKIGASEYKSTPFDVIFPFCYLSQEETIAVLVQSDGYLLGTDDQDFETNVNDIIKSNRIYGAAGKFA